MILSPPAEAASDPPFIVVDLDGTLTPVDTLHEAMLQIHRLPPLIALRALRSLRQGKASFKHMIAGLTSFDPAVVPLRSDLLAWLASEQAAGRRIIVVSAADQAIVDHIAALLPFPIEAAIGSDGLTNLSGVGKLARIRELVGDDFIYAGDAAVDLPIWRAARGAVLVGRGLRFEKKLADTPIVARFPHSATGPAVWIKALRVYQWPKNLLVLLPILLAGPLAMEADWVEGLLAFLMLCALASVGYVVNDLLDLAADRRHPTKRVRPFASGVIPVAHGIVIVPALLIAALALGAVLPIASTVVAMAYLCGTLGYSFFLKKVPILDVIVLACLFTLRVLAGIVLLDAPWSLWLLTFSMFFFLSLALVKRFAELREVSLSPERELKRRGYVAEDLPILLSFGTSAAIAATVIFVVYLIQEQFPRDIYAAPEWLWVIFVLLLFWLGRVWHLAVRGRMNEDPLLFALKDRISHGLGMSVLIIILLARHA